MSQRYVGDLLPSDGLPLAPVATNNFMNLLLWFLIITAGAYFVLLILKPAFVLKRNALGLPTDDVDQSRLIFSSVIVAVIVVLLVYWCRRAQVTAPGII